MSCLRTNSLRAGGLAAALLFCLAAPGVLPADDDPTERYFAQLRQRGLFSLAEGYCLSRLADNDLPLGRRTQLTIELSRTFSEHARFTSGTEQAELWQRSTAVIGELLESHAGNPRRLLLEAQRALSQSAQGEHLRWQAELFPYDKTLAPRAKVAFDGALTQLKEVEQAAAEQARRRAPRLPAGTDALSAWEVRSLSYHLRHQIGHALIERAQLDAPGSADRVAALQQAESWLEPLATGTPERRLTLESRLLLAESSRLRGDRKKAADVVQSMRGEDLPTDLRDRATAVEARLLLDADRAPDAAQLLSRYRTERRGLPGELLFLQIKALSVLWEAAEEHRQTDLAAQLMEQIEAHADRAESEVGGLWAYRCRMLVETALETKRYGVELAAVVREARAHYAAGRTGDAAAAYGRAFAAAEQAGKNEIAMDIGYTRASVQLQSQDYEQAADGFQQLAERFPDSPRAATAHLLSAYSLGRFYDERRTGPRRERYTDALVRHRERYAGDETAVEATWMLALLEERRLQVTRALTLYREIPAGHPRGPAAEAAVARCYEKILDRVRQLGRPVDAWEDDAIARLEEMTAAYAGGEEPLSIEQTEVCLRFARICLNRAQPDYQRAGGLLDRIESAKHRREQQPRSAADSEETKNRWNALHQTATQLRIVTLAGRGRIQEAELLVRTLAEAKPREVLGILDGLNELTASADASTRHRLGELQLSAARDLERRRAELESAEQRRLDDCLAQAYVATGRSSQAVEVYESLLSQAPKDRQLLKTVAELLTDCGTPPCLEKAKSHWRTLESLAKAGEPEWMNARYHVALCACALEQYDECRKLLAVTRLVYPGLGGDEMRERFAELEKRIPE